MRKVHKNRLLKLANFLRGLKGSRKFNLSIITKITHDKNYWDRLVLPSKEYASPKEGFCGTAACAIGWCPVVFPDACKYSVLPAYDDVDENVSEASVVSRRDSNLTDFDWAEKYFGLDFSSSGYLFSPDSYPEDRMGAISVANRIEKFVSNNGKLPNSYIY